MEERRREERRATLILVASLLFIPSVCLGAPTHEADSVQPSASDLAKYAPPGTWGILVIDVPRFRAARRGILQYWTGIFPCWPRKSWASEDAKSVACFLLPGETEGKRGFAWCGLVDLQDASAARIQEHCLRLGGRPSPGAPDVYDRSDGGQHAIIGKNMIMLASNDRSLTALHESYLGGGARIAPQLQKTIWPFAAEPLYGALILPSDLTELFSPGQLRDIPPSLIGAAGSVYAAGIGDGLHVRATVKHQSADDAQGMCARQLQRMVETRTRIIARTAEDPDYGPSPDLIASMFERIVLSAQGSSIELTARFDAKEWDAFGWLYLRPALVPHINEQRKRTDRHFLAGVGSAIRSYRAENDGRSPPNLEVLLENGHLDPWGFFISPVSGTPVGADDGGELYRWEYVGPVPPNAHPHVIVCYTRKGLYPDGRNVLRVDGTFQWVSEEELQGSAATWRSLAHSYELLMERLGDQLTDQQKERLREFYELADPASTEASSP